MINLTEQQLTELFLDIKESCLDAETDSNSNSEKEHWKSVSIGAEILYKSILNDVKYKNLAESNK
jgi:hypothetical protein